MVVVIGEELLMMVFVISLKFFELKVIVDKVIEFILLEELDNIISEWSMFKFKFVSFDESL